MDLNITYPTVNIITGTTPTLVAMEMMELLAHHDPIDRHKVAYLFMDTQMQNVDLVDHINEYNDLFHIEVLPITVPFGVRNTSRELQGGDPTEPHTFISDWIPYATAAGAGGVRNNGHVSLAVIAATVRDKIVQAMDHVQVRLDGDSGPLISDVYVNIVTFLGGGTGSGTVNDLAALVQEIGRTNPKYRVRAQIHGLLPVPGDNTGFAAELKMANCTAALLELLALSMAPGGQPDRKYTKWLREMPLELSINQNIASCVYLYGRGRFGKTDDMARALGLNLYLLATNKSGVGQALAAAFIDHVGAIAGDDRGLPSLFGSCCTLAVRVPTRELSQAFAYKISERLLDKIINGEHEAKLPEGEKKEPKEWDDERCRIGDQPSAMDIPAFSRVQRAPRFASGEFHNPTDSTIHQLKGKAERQREACKTRIHEDWAQWIRYERQLIVQVLDAQISPRHKIRRLEAKMQEYDEVIRFFSNQNQPAGPTFPDDAGQEVLRTVHKSASAHEDACEDCASAFNAWQDDSAYSDRSAILVSELRKLVERFQPQVNALRDVRIHVDDEQGRLLNLWKRSPGREGRLERPHLFQSSLFETPRLQANRAQLIENELFEAVTYQLKAWPAGGRLGDDDADQSLVDRCVQVVGAPPNQQAASGFVDKIVRHFTAEYLDAFDKFNVFGILRVLKPDGPGRGRTYDDQEMEITRILTDHLTDRFQLVDPTYGFVPSQYARHRQGAGFYVGVQANEENDKRMFGGIVARVINLNTNRPQPRVSYDNHNPHMIEVSLDEYGITMSTMPDFNYPTNTMMNCFLDMIRDRKQGKIAIPEYTSSATEHLIEDPDALPFYTDNAGITQRKQLYERVIRRGEK